VNRFFGEAVSIFVEAYDAFYESSRLQIAGDIDFYAELAQNSNGPLLEIGCGTGRITLPMADRGFDIVGIDLSEGMLAVAREKAKAYTEATQRRIRLIAQDMTALDLDERFGFAFVPFRSFQHLLSSDAQMKALVAIRKHLTPNGTLALHLFDPRFDLLIDGAAAIPDSFGRNDKTGRRYVASVVRTHYDRMAQIRRDLWRYSEIDESGKILCEDTCEMALRWTYRWELYHLLALTGFSVEAEYSDFQRSPPAYGKELIVVCKADR